MKRNNLVYLCLLSALFINGCNSSNNNSVSESTSNNVANSEAYINILDYGAKGDDTKDDYNAFAKAALANKSIYVPAGTYYVSKPIQLFNCNLIGAGVFQTFIYSTDTSLNTCVVEAGRTCVIENVTIGFKKGIVNGNELQGERVGLKTGSNGYSLQRGSAIRNCRFTDCGTAIYGDNEENQASFSVTYDTLEIIDFSFRGIDFESNIRTGNVYNNIYIISQHKEVDSLMYLVGEESEATFTQINLEHTKCRNALTLDGVRAFTINSLHIEGCHLNNEGESLININNSSGVIDALSVYYIALDYKNLSIINVMDNSYDVGSSYSPATLGYLKINNFHVKGLHCPHAPIWGNRTDGLNNKDNEGFTFISRPLNAKNDYVVRVENYIYYTFLNDMDKYEEFACDSNNRITFEKKGVIKTYGPTSERPTTRLCPYYSTYYDTTLHELFIYDGTNWIDI